MRGNKNKQKKASGWVHRSRAPGGDTTASNKAKNLQGKKIKRGADRTIFLFASQLPFKKRES